MAGAGPGRCRCAGLLLGEAARLDELRLIGGEERIDALLAMASRRAPSERPKCSSGGTRSGSASGNS